MHCSRLRCKRSSITFFVKFYFQKVDGTMREAYGTLCEKYMPAVTGTDKRAKNDTIQTYFDTERGEFRCFKKANLLKLYDYDTLRD